MLIFKKALQGVLYSGCYTVPRMRDYLKQRRAKMLELLTQVNIIQTAVAALEKNLPHKEHVLVDASIGEIKMAVGTMKQLISRSTAEDQPE
jgi:outer membrane murein-binding lipoprotein Lpp